MQHNQQIRSMKTPTNQTNKVLLVVFLLMTCCEIVAASSSLRRQNADPEDENNKLLVDKIVKLQEELGGAFASNTDELKQKIQEDEVERQARKTAIQVIQRRGCTCYVHVVLDYNDAFLSSFFRSINISDAIRDCIDLTILLDSSISKSIHNSIFRSIDINYPIA